MNKKLCIALVFTSLCIGVARAQDTPNLTDTTYWKSKVLFGLNGTQTSFVNWSAGGRNNFSALAFLDGNALFQKGNLKWNNDVKIALGGLQFLDKEGVKEQIQKTDDRIDLSSALGYEFKKKWFYTAMGTFKTQMMDGYVLPNDSIRASRFMAPAYLNFSLGIEYVPSSNFSLYLSPISMKTTIVNDQVLADAGAFGVDGATYTSQGALLTNGSRVRNEFGAYFKLTYSKELMTNIQLKSRLELFSNYAEKPQNVDVNAEAIITFKINKWFTSSLQWNLVYDDDIRITDNKGNVGPRTQFKSVLGLGVAYTLKSKFAKDE